MIFRDFPDPLIWIGVCGVTVVHKRVKTVVHKRVKTVVHKRDKKNVVFAVLTKLTKEIKSFLLKRKELNLTINL